MSASPTASPDLVALVAASPNAVLVLAPDLSVAAVSEACLRLFKAVELLAGGQDVTQVALALGYASPSAFTAMFHQAMGQSPSAYRQTVGLASGG